MERWEPRDLGDLALTGRRRIVAEQAVEEELGALLIAGLMLVTCAFSSLTTTS
jgi:hypothetical protein